MKNIHPLQSKEWRNFREKTGVKVVRIDDLQLTIHPIPHTQYTIGYLPKGPLPTKQMLAELQKVGSEQKCVFIQLEPNVENIKNYKLEIRNLGLVPSAHPLFTKYTFVLDLTQSEEELLKNMHPKTRYNIRIAEKKGVKVIEDNSDEAFETYLKLTKETTQRQKFYAHNENYHRLMWETLKTSNFKLQTENDNELTAHLFTTTYNNEVLVTWIVFVLGDTLYYPYGASSNNHREVMASNLMMWEVIKFGKKLGLKKFDMWGALGQNPDTKDPWYGFHRFKEGYGGKLTEFVGSYDFVIDKKMYLVYKLLNKIRWAVLRIK
jgi:lipid II:glycine glycyltransferase (peptidoglycan interpeptide bridge formation enzyme)